MRSRVQAPLLLQTQTPGFRGFCRVADRDAPPVLWSRLLFEHVHPRSSASLKRRNRVDDDPLDDPHLRRRRASCSRLSCLLLPLLLLLPRPRSSGVRPTTTCTSRRPMPSTPASLPPPLAGSRPTVAVGSGWVCSRCSIGPSLRSWQRDAAPLAVAPAPPPSSTASRLLCGHPVPTRDRAPSFRRMTQTSPVWGMWPALPIRSVSSAEFGFTPSGRVTGNTRPLHFPVQILRSPCRSAQNHGDSRLHPLTWAVRARIRVRHSPRVAGVPSSATPGSPEPSRPSGLERALPWDQSVRRHRFSLGRKSPSRFA